MDFSVLISVYYRENPSFFRQSLKSVWNQTVKPSEIVVVKDGPLNPELDSILDELKSIMPVKIIQLSENGGLGKALNAGLQVCSNELVARMDSDDISMPERFEKELAVFEARPELDVVGSWVDEFQGTTENVVNHRIVPETDDEIRKYARHRNPMNHPTVMFRKSSVLASGSYVHMALYEDYYLWVRMLCAGFRFYNIQSSLLYFRVSPDLYKRRGGIKYVEYDVNFQKKAYKLGFIGPLCVLTNLLERVPIRLVPNHVRKFIYEILRK